MSKSSENRNRDRTGSRRHSEQSGSRPTESGWKSFILGTGYSDPDRRIKLGFSPVFFGLLALLIIAATLFYQWPTVKEDTAFDLQDIDELVQFGTEDQLFERLKELNLESSDEQRSSTTQLLRLQNNIDVNRIASRLLEQPLDKNRLRMVASFFLRSGNEIILLSGTSDNESRFDRAGFEDGVQALKSDIDVQIAKEAWFTSLLIAISKYVQAGEEKDKDQLSPEMALQELLTRFPDDLWVANNVLQLKPVFLDGRLEPPVRERLWAMIANHYGQSSQTLLQQFAASAERVLVKLKYDFETLDRLSRPGFESEYQQFITIYREIWSDESLRPGVARQLLVFPKRFESRGDIPKAVELLELCQPSLADMDGWQPFVEDRDRVMARLSQIGKRTEIPETWDDAWNSAFANSRTVVVFLGQSTAKRRILLEQLVALVRTRTDSLSVVVVYPERQRPFIENEMSVFQDKLDIHFFQDSNPESEQYRAHFFAEQGNVAHLFRQGALVRSNVGFDRLFSIVPNLN